MDLNTARDSSETWDNFGDLVGLFLFKCDFLRIRFDPMGFFLSPWYKATILMGGLICLKNFKVDFHLSIKLPANPSARLFPKHVIL